MVRPLIWNTTLIVSLLLPSSLFAQTIIGDAAAGEKKALICSACHGPAGVSVNPLWPKLAGQHATYTIKQLKNFKAGSQDPDQALRYDPSMSPQANLLSEQDMADLAAYFASQPTNYAAADETLVERGRQLYRGGDIARNIPACTACHSPSGHGNAPAGYPSVAGQHSDYIIKQLNDFKRGIRRNDTERVMRDIAERLSEDDIKAIASYMQGVKP